MPFTAKQHGTSTNSTQADRVEQSELSDQFEDTEPFENFDHSVNVNVLGPVTDNIQENKRPNTSKQNHVVGKTQHKNAKRKNKKSSKSNGHGLPIASKNGTINILSQNLI